MSMWELPVLTKEMRSRTRGWRRWLHHALIASPFLFFVVQVALYLGGKKTQPLSTLVLVELAACLLLVPAFAAGAFAREVQQHTQESLFFTPLTTRSIVLSKWLSSLMSVFFLIAGVMPLAVGWCFFDANLLMFLGAQGIILLTAGLVAAIALYCSTFFRRVVSATATAYATTLFFLMAIPMLLYLDYLPISLPFDSRQICDGLSPLISASMLAVGVIWSFSLVTSLLIRRPVTVLFQVISFLIVLIAIVPFIGFMLGTIFDDILLIGNPIGVLFVLLDSAFWSPFYFPTSTEPNYLATGIIAPLILTAIFLHLTMLRVAAMRKSR